MSLKVEPQKVPWLGASSDRLPRYSACSSRLPMPSSSPSPSFSQCFASCLSNSRDSTKNSSLQHKRLIMYYPEGSWSATTPSCIGPSPLHEALPSSLYLSSRSYIQASRESRRDSYLRFRPSSSLLTSHAKRVQLQFGGITSRLLSNKGIAASSSNTCSRSFVEKGQTDAVSVPLCHFFT